MMLVHIVESLLMIGWHMIGIYLVRGWMHLFMVQVDYRLVHGWCTCLWYRLITGWGTGWCMVQIYWYKFISVYLTVIVWQWFHHSTSTLGRLDRARTGGCRYLSVVDGEHRGLSPPSSCIHRIGELDHPSGCSLGNKVVGDSFHLQLENKGIWCFQWM